MVTIDGEKRSSIVIDPADGKIPPMTEEGKARDDSFGGLAGRTDVLERRGETPNGFDDPELRVNSERCLVGWGWTSGTPILPNYLYNNLKQIVQTPTEVMILTEMIHDARIVRIGGQHLPSNVRKWLGDSVGHWEGDTLVVETTNFTDKTRFHGSSENLKVTERFTRLDANTFAVSLHRRGPAYVGAAMDWRVYVGDQQRADVRVRLSREQLCDGRDPAWGAGVRIRGSGGQVRRQMTRNEEE